ncbi:MAG: tryptophan--tRNA ligase [Defluviitaleaceae bacterium]|nr:tryptophan--tRNA ligase [Defluviitaleaceae bacterium]
MSKKVIFSGMQPSGVPHIGNYFGAIKNWADLQDDYNCLYCIVDLHAITVRQSPDELRKNTLNALALYIACGLDPDKNTIYVQSHYNGHSELSWLLSCFAYMGELGRMTQYKDKSANNPDNINLGLFAYPVLQAADILLFGSHLVPIGDDQKQHLELTRDIAIRFNNIYGDIFTIPEVFTPKTGARIKRLSDPEKKMSKSDGEAHYVGILDPADVVMKKFKRAVTDSDTEIRHDPENKAGVSSLLEIYALACGITLEASLAEFEGKQYGHLKTTVAQAVIDNVTSPIQAKYNELIKNPEHLQQIAKTNAEKAKNIGDKVLVKVKNAIGLI